VEWHHILFPELHNITPGPGNEAGLGVYMGCLYRVTAADRLEWSSLFHSTTQEENGPKLAKFIETINGKEKTWYVIVEGQSELAIVLVYLPPSPPSPSPPQPPGDSPPRSTSLRHYSLLSHPHW